MSENHHEDVPDEGRAGTDAAAHDVTPGTASTGWGAAPTPTATTADPTLVRPAPSAGPQDPYAWGHQYGQQQDPYAVRNDPYGASVPPTPWYGAAAGPAVGRTKPRRPWFWPVIAAAVGVAALLAGGGIGFAIGHAIGAHQSQSSTQMPGRNGYGYPGGSNGFPGQQQNGSGSSGSGSSGSDSSGSSGSGTSGSGTSDGSSS